ncbi:MAG: zeta toxin family protein [Bacteroidota bacterium]|nr:zeta toxin family protein [Bacteroidota bacterium]
MDKNLSEQDLKVEQAAILFIKEHARIIQRHFADIEKFSSVNKPVSIFMAGSPGAGKTEFSKRFIKDLGKPIVRIDPDEIRDMLPQYDRNATLMQRAAALGVEKVYDYALHNNQDLILDGTLIDYEKAVTNIQRSLNHNRLVKIYYIYQEPILAWDFTKKREAIENRCIPKEFFIKSFFKSKENVNRLKSTFKNLIQVNLIVKNFENDIEHIWLDIDQVDLHLKIEYTELVLQDLLQ